MYVGLQKRREKKKKKKIKVTHTHTGSHYNNVVRNVQP